MLPSGVHTQPYMYTAAACWLLFPFFCISVVLLKIGPWKLRDRLNLRTDWPQFMLRKHEHRRAEQAFTERCSGSSSKSLWALLQPQRALLSALCILQPQSLGAFYLLLYSKYVTASGLSAILLVFASAPSCSHQQRYLRMDEYLWYISRTNHEIDISIIHPLESQKIRSHG